MAGRAPAPGHTVKLPNRMYAEAVFAAEFRSRTVGQLGSPHDLPKIAR